jgi:hypothetical protein
MIPDIICNLYSEDHSDYFSMQYAFLCVTFSLYDTVYSAHLTGGHLNQTENRCRIFIVRIWYYKVQDWYKYSILLEGNIGLSGR